MGIKLIYHDKESLRRGTSPFDEAIIEFKNFHEPAVYEAVMNLSYRNNLLDEAFS